MRLQSTGSYDANTGEYSLTVATDKICFSLEPLERHELESLADCIMLILYSEDEEYTWHHEFQPNDVF
jgi:hypothetical protein